MNALSICSMFSDGRTLKNDDESTGIRGRGWLELEPGQPVEQLLDLVPSVFEVKAVLGRIVIF